MAVLMLQCTRCATVFSSGFGIGVGATVQMRGNRSQCPRCGSLEQVPDGTFRGTAEGVINLVTQSASPVDTARELLELLKRAHAENRPELVRDSVLAKWMPDTPEKLAAYIGILVGVLSVILTLLTRDPTVHIEYNQTFINSFNSTLERSASTTSQTEKTEIARTKEETRTAQRVKGTRVGRNDLCTCGSGKKYKKCCGA